MGFAHQDSQQDRIMRRAEKVRSLRLAGFTYRQIAEKLDVGIDTVRKDWDRIQVEYPEQTTRELVAEQNDKLIEMMKPHYLKAIKGDYKSTDRMVKLLDHQAKLFNAYNQESHDGVNDAKNSMIQIMDALLNAPPAESRATDA